MHVLLRGDIVQKFRLVSGLILFLFATTHFLNHAVGLVHIESMHELQTWRLFVTRSIPGTVILASALVGDQRSVVLYAHSFVITVEFSPMTTHVPTQQSSPAPVEPGSGKRNRSASAATGSRVLSSCHSYFLAR